MENVVSFIRENRERYVAELVEFLRIPSISNSPRHNQDTERCARFVADLMRKAGIQRTEIFRTPGHPIVYGEWCNAPGRPTVLVYGHYDVQPVDPLELWVSPPFEPAVRNGEIYARGSADDKGQVYIHIAAVEAHLNRNGKLPVNVKFLIEGEEEVGSENLGKFVDTHREMLRSDVVLISDTAMFQRGVPSICYGLRGLSYLQQHRPALRVLRGRRGEPRAGACANPRLHEGQERQDHHPGLLQGREAPDGEGAEGVQAAPVLR